MPHCRVCNTSHPRPVGSKCAHQRPASSPAPLQAEPQTVTEPSQPALTDILTLLTDIKASQQDMNTRLVALETPAASPPTAPTVLQSPAGIAQLRHTPPLQAQVDARIEELRSAAAPISGNGTLSKNIVSGRECVGGGKYQY